MFWRGIFESWIDAFIFTLFANSPEICKSSSLFRTEFWLLPTVTPLEILPFVIMFKKLLFCFDKLLFDSLYSLLRLSVLSIIISLFNFEYSFDKITG